MLKEALYIGADGAGAELPKLRQYDKPAAGELLASAIPDTLIQVDPQGIVVDLKPGRRWPASLSGAKLAGQSLTRLVADKRDKTVLAAVFRVVETGDEESFEFEYVSAGKTAYFEARITRMVNGNALVIIRDIGDWWRSEACAISLLDIATAVQEEVPLEHALRLACERIRAIFGVPLVWVGRKEPDSSVKIFAHTGKKAGYFDDIKLSWDNSPYGDGLTGNAIRTGRFQVMNLDDPRLSPWRDWLKKYAVVSGAAFPLKVGGAILGSLTVYTDEPEFWSKRTILHLTSFAEQVAIAIQVATNRQRLRLLTAGLEAAANALVITDRDGYVQWYNPAFLQINGYSPADAIAGKVRLIEAGHKSRSLHKEVWQQIAKGRIWSGELTNRRKDGSRYPAEVNITPVRDGKGDITNYIAIIQDITTRKQVEGEMLEARETIARAERLGAMGIMAAGIAHEINQPLNSLKVMADSMLFWYKHGRVPELSSAMETLGEISKEADRIDLIIKHMRAFISSDQIAVPVPTSLNRAVEEALFLVGAQLAAHDIKVDTSLQEDLPLVPGTGTQFEQIIVNLLVNAMHALDTLDKAGKTITITTGTKKDVVFLSVSDNGPGISKEVKRKIFDPFFTTKPAGTGMGLGLSIILSIVTAHGGRIRAKDNKPGGVTFIVEFPAASDQEKGE